MNDREEEKKLFKDIRIANRMKGDYILLNDCIPVAQMNRHQMYEFLKKYQHRITDDLSIQVYEMGDTLAEGVTMTVQKFLNSYFDLANIETAYLDDSKTAVVYLKLSQIELISSVLQYALNAQGALLGQEIGQQRQRIHYIIQDLINDLDVYKERIK